MESSLLLLIKVPSPETLDKIQCFLGEDPPIFAEDVEKSWRPMFNALEELMSPEDMVQLSEDLLLLTWTCGDWEEFLRETHQAFQKASCTELVAYIWCDEEEAYFKSGSSKLKRQKIPTVSDALLAKVTTALNDWEEEEDIDVVAGMLTLLDS